MNEETVGSKHLFYVNSYLLSSTSLLTVNEMEGLTGLALPHF
jgi:hypothetical protein